MLHNRNLLPLTLSLLLAACSSQPEQSSSSQAPVPQEKPQVIEIPQASGAIPRPEPLSASGNQDYWIGEQKQEVWRDIKHYTKEGIASWVTQDQDGRKTANGDLMDSTQFSAAHRNLPLPSYVRVTNLDNGLETVVRVNDRGPLNDEHLIALSHAAAQQLDMVNTGEARVRLELINDAPDQIVEMAPMLPMTPTTVPTTAPTMTPTATAAVAPKAASHPVVAEPAPAKAATASTGQDKMIQVLASGSQARADAMGKVMTQRYGVPYQVVAHESLFRVLIGPVAAEQQTELLAQIRQGGLEQAFIVP